MGSRDWFLTPSFTGWGANQKGRCGNVRGPAARNSRSADSWRPLAVGGDPGGCRCPFPVEGPRARVARGGKERRPFRRVTAAESRRLTHPGCPSLPGPERPGPGRPREQEIPPAVPRARNWGHWATGPPVLGQGHRCTDLPGLEPPFPGGLGAHTQRPAPGLELSSLGTPNPDLNPFLSFLAERGEWQVIPGALTVQPGILLGGFLLIYRISQNLRPN